MLVPPQEIYGIIGHPLGHSLSPLLFTTLFAETARPAAYFRWDIDPGALDALFTAVRLLRIRGLSVTIPYKQAVMPFLDEVSPRAHAAGAVNTLYWQEDRLCGENTDIRGFLAGLGPRQESEKAMEIGADTRALLLGCGGAARAVLAGLREKGVKSIRLCARSEEKAAPLLHDFGVDFLPWEDRTRGCLENLGIDLVINSTPLGMQGKLEGETPLPATAFAGSRPGLAYDLVYRPRPTRFLREAASSGWRVQDGLAMFLGQAEEQYRLWTGKPWTSHLANRARQELEQALLEDKPKAS